jgi:hypothetical protein
MLYREEIPFFSKSFYGILLFLTILTLWLLRESMHGIIPALIIIAVFPLLFGRLVIIVDNNILRVTFGYLGIIGKEIRISEIDESRVVEYRPLRQFGGWGIRCGKFEGERTGCYTLKGNKGLLLILSKEIRLCFAKTRRVIIGSRSPEKLKASIEK